MSTELKFNPGRAGRFSALAWGLALGLAARDAGALTGPPPTKATATRSRPPAPAELPGVIYHGPRDAKRLALTFDACSLPTNDRIDQGVLDTLIKEQVPATLFLGGKWMEDDAAVVATLARNAQFELASHSYLHPHLMRLSPRALDEELQRSQADFEKLVGHQASYFRAPYGELDARVVLALTRNGLAPVQYDLPSGDPDPHFTKKVLVKWVVGHAQPGGIVVMHINGNGKHTAEALPDIVEGLRKKGFELVRLSDLLHPPPAPNPAKP